jgi:hypothetical protein
MVERFTIAGALDFAVLGLAGGVLAIPLFGEGIAWSFAAGCLWLGLNFALLGLLVRQLGPGVRPNRLFKLSIACAKLPAAYLLLLWLFSREFMETLGLVAALVTLPGVLVFRGLRESRLQTAAEVSTSTEEQA